MSSPWFIITATPEIRLDPLPGELSSSGVFTIDPVAVYKVNHQILDSRGLTPASPIPSPSFRPNPERIAANARSIETLVDDSMTAPSAAVGAEFPLALEDWISAEPRAIICLTSPGIAAFDHSASGEISPACLWASKQYQMKRLAEVGEPVVFFNVEGQSWPEVATMLSDFMSQPTAVVETVIDWKDPFTDRPTTGELPAPASPFRIRFDLPLDPIVTKELEYSQQCQVQRAAQLDRLAVYEKELNKLSG